MQNACCHCYACIYTGVQVCTSIGYAFSFWKETTAANDGSIRTISLRFYILKLIFFIDFVELDETKLSGVNEVLVRNSDLPGTDII